MRPDHHLRHLRLLFVVVIASCSLTAKANVIKSASCFVSSSFPGCWRTCENTRGTGEDHYRKHVPTQEFRKVPMNNRIGRRRHTWVAMDVSNSDDNTSMREVFSSPLNRRLLLGGWSAAVGATLVNAALNSRDERRSSLTRRRNLFKSITEDVREFRSILEIGIGGDTGLGSFANLEFFRPGQRIVGIDPALSEGTSRKLEKASQQAFKRGIELEGIGGVAEELPFESGTFDAVVSTMVFCTVRDPDKALREVSRVLRPGGKFVFIEHVLAPEEGWLGLRHQQELFDPLQQILASGCHLTRETGQLVKAAASGSPSSRLFSRLDSLENVRLQGSWPISEQVYGVAVK